MNAFNELQNVALMIAERYALPDISRFFLPKYFESGQPKNAEFMAIGLEDGSTGISYVSISPEEKEYYLSLEENDFVGKSPLDLALMDKEKEIDAMLSLAAINAISQYGMKRCHYRYDITTDALGLLDITKNDMVGMVGFFPPLVKIVAESSAQLTIIEKKEIPFKGHPNVTITFDPSELQRCNKILCTSTVILNDSLDEILSYCANAQKVSVVGPTAGFFPDPLFDRGVDVVGASFVIDQKGFFSNIEKGQRWGDTTQKYIISSDMYVGIRKMLKKKNNNYSY